MPRKIFHFTCDHAARGIGRRGELRPMPQPFLEMRPVVWLTDMATPDRAALGLTSNLLGCDRTAFRYIAAPTSTIVSWAEWKSDHQLDAGLVADLEHGRQPAAWFVSAHPVKARLG